MAETITMPDLGFEATGGVLATWLKGVGDPIQSGEPIAEIESDKVTLEVESPFAGIVLELLIQPGQNAPVGAPVATVGATDELREESEEKREDREHLSPLTEDAAGEDRLADVHSVETPRGGESEADRERLPLLTPPSSLLTHRATPIALRMAKDHNLDLSQVAASGPGGRILRQDVEDHLARSRPDSSAAADLPTSPQPGAQTPTAPAEHVAASPLRRAIARRMSQSKQTIPHFYITKSVTMDDALALRKQINAALAADAQVTVNDLVMKATALALRDFPSLNASYIDDQIVYQPEINIGAAVSVDGGVLTVVNRQTDCAAVPDIARANRAMIQRARAGKVRPEDVTGGTFTVSNLGAFDTEHFAAIISPPQAAILAVATARETAVVVSGQVVVRTVMQITISADHRVTDGAECARFLQRVQELLEAPIKLLLA